MRCRCHSSCRRSRFSQLGTQIRGKPSSSSKRRISCASGDRSFASAPAWCGSGLRLQSTTQTATPTSIVRTNGRARWLPFSHALSALPERDRISPPLRGALIAFPETLRSRYPPKLAVIAGRDQLATRERWAGMCGAAEWSVAPMKPGNSGGGKGPQLKTDARSNEGYGD